jgi:alkaline phosphatase
VHFADQNPDALVILCSDHGNPNPGLSSGANGADAFFRNASKFECSHTSILDRINAESSKEYIQKAIREVASLDIPMEHAALMQDRLRGKYSAAYSRMSGLHAIIGQIIANHTEIGWMSNTHTSDHVELWRLWTRQ